MKLTSALSAVVLGLAAVSCGSAPKTTQVQWETLGNQSDENGNYYVERFTVTGNLDFDRLAFNQFARKMTPVNPADTLIEIIPGYYCISSPRFRAAEGDTVVVDIRVNGELRAICYGPDGVHTANFDGSTAPAELTFASMTEFPAQYSTPASDLMPKGEEIYAFNEALAADVPGDYEAVPSFKKVTLTDGESNVADIKIVEKAGDPSLGEKYTITIADNTATVEAAPAFMKTARHRAENLVAGFAGPTVANAVVEDEPDFRYRAVMIDISRNFQTPAEMRRIIDLLARYGFNHLHFHFSDDDAWRLEIPGLPELTEVGARRGYTMDEADFIGQIHAGNGNPDAKEGTANGYFTKEDFISMLRYADSLGVKVLPEVESPGHARAAIKAMEKRYRTTGDASLRLIEDGDSSVYTSAQSFHDNVMNPALESTYAFLEKVYDGIIDMYAEAGVELPAIHIGGDEVPRGAWGGTPSVIKYKEEHGIANDHDMHAVFNRRASDYLKSKGVKVSGWQEVVCGRTDDYNNAVAPNAYSVNSWTQSLTTPDAPSRQALDGNYPLILSNVNRFYFDMAPSYHPEERGLTWSTPVDEFIALGGYPEVLVVLQPGDHEKIFGLSGQVWSETVRSGADLEMRLLPNMLGLAERAWNSTPTYTDADFNAVISAREIPAWEAGNYNYHLHQPGVKVVDGKAVMNASYAGKGEIRYTLDGSNPTAESPVYTEPVAIGDAKQIRAAYFLNGKHSVTTIVRL
ncbi:MAG: family 20 glycosylhydrolase [Muribaculaceae bacterium]|nr:family 20 glycosylhydrolase [Muribaculaceae bacterium]